MIRKLCTGAAVALACTAALLPAAALAQSPYPNKMVKIVVPFPPGGSNDVIARVMAQQLTERTGQPFIVENRAGAGGNVGSDAVAKAEPDGHTLLLTASPPLTSNIALYEKMPFDPAKAFAPVALIASVPIVLVTHPSFGAASVKDVIALAKAKPGTVNFGSSGNGSTNHLVGELLKRRADIDIVHIAYKGAAPALNDLIAGQIPMMFDNIPALLPQIRGKTINAIAVAGPARIKALPNVPTVAEAGLSGFEASAWFGLVAPANTPPAVLAKLQADVDAVLQKPDVRKRFDDLGAEPGHLSGDAFKRFIGDETTKWVKIIKESGAKAD